MMFFYMTNRLTESEGNIQYEDYTFVRLTDAIF